MTKQSYNATLLCKRTILQASASYTQLTPLTPVKTDMSSHVNENKEPICICKIVIKLNCVPCSICSILIVELCQIVNTSFISLIRNLQPMTSYSFPNPDLNGDGYCKIPFTFWVLFSIYVIATLFNLCSLISTLTSLHVFKSRSISLHSCMTLHSTSFVH